MSMWSTLFGAGAAANKKKQDAAKNSIVKLREQVTMLEKKEAHLQKQIDDLTATAKRNVTTNKKGVSPFRCGVDDDSCVSGITEKESVGEGFR
jgi:uncharacterized protein YlxW (UPF0749 family)